MFKHLCNFAMCFLVLSSSSIVFAQPALDPDSGSITSGSSIGNNNINCWISRNSERAVAVHVYEENNQLKANFRQYLFDGESYGSTKTKIMNGATELEDTAVIPVKLVAVNSSKYPNLFKMVYSKDVSGTITDYDIGHLNFVRGNKQRASSKVSITLLDTATGVKVTPSAGNPCDEPVIDDIGEEEEITKSLTIPKAPTNFVPPIANPGIPQ